MTLIKLILVILFIYIYVTKSNNIEELKKEIKKLKEENEILKRKIYPDDSKNIESDDKVRDNYIVQNNNKVDNIKETNTHEKTKLNINQKNELEKEENQLKKAEEKAKKEKERKNTTILATGAIFIILAAIVLLTSTWHVMPNIIKTGILILIAAVFFALSSFAKEKKLNKAAKAFYYIAMAYIPIFCISISVFGFLGKYLSIDGEGKYIYFTIAGIANSFFYYIEYKRKNMPELFYGSILIQVLTVVMFGCIFENKIQNIVFCILLYNIEFILLTKNNKFLKDNKYIYNILPYFGLVCCANLILTVNSFIVLCDLFFVAINFLVLYFKDKNISNFALFNTVINILGFYFVWKITSSLTITLKNIMAILYFSIINGCIIEINKNKAIKNTSIIQLLVCMQTVFFINISSSLNMFVIALIQLLISIYAYKKLKENANLSLGINVLIFLYTIISQILLAFVLKISNYQWFVFSGICTFIIYEFINKYIIKREEIKQSNFYMSHLYIASIIVVTFILNFQQLYNNIFDWIILTTIYLYSMIKNKGNSIATLFKYLTYITIGITLYSICNCIKMPTDVKLLVPAVITVLFSCLEPKLKIKSDTDNIFKIILYIVSYLCIAFIHGIGAVIVAIILTLVISAVNYLQENNKSITNLADQIVPFIGFILVGLITFSQKEIEPFILQITYLSIFIVNSICSIFKNKKELFTITAGIYLIMAVISAQSKYFGAIIFLIWNIYNYFIIFKEASYKELFKVAIYINLLVLYNFIIGDLNFNQYATIGLLGYLICSIAISDIIKKFADIPFKEIAVSLINLYALTIYLNNFDGMLFTLVLISIVIYSYYKKSGNLFIVTIVNIMVNIFALTRKFWFSVPWWVYLLVVGSALIGFAVKNEANENKSLSKGIVKNIKNIKEKIDNGV